MVRSMFKYFYFMLFIYSTNKLLQLMNNHLNIDNIYRAKRLILSRMIVTKGRNGRLVLFNKKNKTVFDTLSQIGCFEFYIDNNKHIIGVSQVVAFLEYGWKALLNGFTAPKGEIEVHHLDGDTTNNTPENLQYLSKQDHLIVSHCSNTEAFGRVKDERGTPFNRSGKAVKSAKHFLSNIIRETLLATSKKRTGITIRISLPTILLSLPKRIHQTIIQSYFPSWMTSSILNSVEVYNYV